MDVGDDESDGATIDTNTSSLRWKFRNKLFLETSRNGAMEKRSGKGSNLAAISHTAKHGKSNVSSRKLPATGRWRKVPGKVQMLGSHLIRGIRVNSAILKLDRAGSRDADTSSL